MSQVHLLHSSLFLELDGGIRERSAITLPQTHWSAAGPWAGLVIFDVPGVCVQQESRSRLQSMGWILNHGSDPTVEQQYNLIGI